MKKRRIRGRPAAEERAAPTTASPRGARCGRDKSQKRCGRRRDNSWPRLEAGAPDGDAGRAGKGVQISVWMSLCFIFAPEGTSTGAAVKSLFRVLRPCRYEQPGASAGAGGSPASNEPAFLIPFQSSRFVVADTPDTTLRRTRDNLAATTAKETSQHDFTTRSP
ncbi:unnamed protein product, partial [Scytosiphon promiscuus]